MFGLNDKNQPDETQMSAPDLVSKSNADLPDGLGAANQPNATGSMPPIAAGPIESAMPSLPLSSSSQVPDSAQNDITSSTDHTAPAPLTQLNGSTEDEMIKMKQQALQNLAPLVGHLDQTPEEKFRTTMMLLQASDNPDLVKEAYGAANEIKDEKARAQALLDVVNEINYFTQHKNNA